MAWYCSSRYAPALEDGDRIRAIIRGSAVGNAGRSAAGQTVPSARSASRRHPARALSGAGLDGSRHRLRRGARHRHRDRRPDRGQGAGRGVRRARRTTRCGVGSVKTNIGHAGSAAGIAGLIKAVLAIENAAVPPSLNFAGASPEVDLEGLGLQINTTLTPWQVGRRAQAGGGVVVRNGRDQRAPYLGTAPAAQAPVLESVAVQRDDGDLMVPWVLSARSRQALANQAERLSAWVGADEDLHSADVAWSLVTTRRCSSTVPWWWVPTRGVEGGLAAWRPVSRRRVWCWVARDRRARRRSYFPDRVRNGWGWDGNVWPVDVFARRRSTRQPQRWTAICGCHCGSDVGRATRNCCTSTEFAQPALFAVEVALSALVAVLRGDA